MEITITSPQFGSNPGGWCTFTQYRNQVTAYLKYANISSLPRITHLDPHNQPIYEAMQVMVAKQIGLLVPKIAVLTGKNISFDYYPGIKNEMRDMPYYFLSYKVEGKNITKSGIDHSHEEKLMQDDYGLLELLQIDDIRNKTQNYLMDTSIQKAIYVDLGCGVVCTVDGIMERARGHRNEVYGLHSRKEVKKTRKRLEDYCPTYSPITQYSLTDIVDMHRKTKIPVLTEGIISKIYPKELLREYELEEFCQVLERCLEKKLPRLKKDGVIERAG